MFTDEFYNGISDDDFNHLIQHLSQDPRATQIILSFLLKEDEAVEDNNQFLQEALEQAEAILAEGE